MNRKRVAGWVLSSLAVAFLLFDGGIKLARIGAVLESFEHLGSPGDLAGGIGILELLCRIGPVRESFEHLGYPGDLAVGLGILELLCVAAYVFPRTAVLGAILLTGYLGGATASQERLGEPLFIHVLFPSYVALLVWGGLYLREGRLAALVPVRRDLESPGAA